nr:hypothetical protein BDOA9_0202000 [Bradyrhizobium sp. DOA9]
MPAALWNGGIRNGIPLGASTTPAKSLFHKALKVVLSLTSDGRAARDPLMLSQRELPFGERLAEDLNIGGGMPSRLSEVPAGLDAPTTVHTESWDCSGTRTVRNVRLSPITYGTD